jgi:hypothetical protein
MCNSYWFSTATVVVQACFCVTFTYIAYYCYFPFSYSLRRMNNVWWQEHVQRCIKCIKNDKKNYLYMTNVYRTFYFLKWRATSRVIQDTEHFRVMKRSECTSVWVGEWGMSTVAGKTFWRAQERLWMTLMGVHDTDLMKYVWGWDAVSYRKGLCLFDYFRPVILVWCV